MKNRFSLDARKALVARMTLADDWRMRTPTGARVQTEHGPGPELESRYVDAVPHTKDPVRTYSPWSL